MRKQRRFCTLLLLVTLIVFTSQTVPASQGTEYFNPAVGGDSDPVYWLDKGALVATYGNYPAAIKFYRKALTLDPNMSEAFYNLGLAYMELRKPNPALHNINQAISIDPDKHQYHYALARVYLLEGQENEALEKFKAAASMGNLDAAAYLENTR
ncbi:MAG: tetratricopeptide repeat protein [Desulfobacteraceae bacterium]|nr:tetratricopeptide repeat protein [Desulfobacteraceae bacterium]